MSQLRDMVGIPNITDVYITVDLDGLVILSMCQTLYWPRTVMNFQTPGANIEGQKKKWINNVKKDLELLELKICVAKKREEQKREIKSF